MKYFLLNYNKTIEKLYTECNFETLQTHLNYNIKNIIDAVVTNVLKTIFLKS